jgi:hypothetical protein
MRLAAPPLLKNLVIVLQQSSDTTAIAAATQRQADNMLLEPKHAACTVTRLTWHQHARFCTVQTDHIARAGVT